MDRRQQLLWQMTAEQFAAFDTQLYLDTHPHDTNAVQMLNNYRNNFSALRARYESMYGPISSDSAAGGAWTWVDNPWPWEREAN